MISLLPSSVRHSADSSLGTNRGGNFSDTASATPVAGLADCCQYGTPTFLSHVRLTVDAADACEARADGWLGSSAASASVLHFIIAEHLSFMGVPRDGKCETHASHPYKYIPLIL